MNDDNVAKLDKRIQNIWHALPRIADEFVLISGTAAVLHLGHRKSYDIDLITSQPLRHPRVIRNSLGIEKLGKHSVVRMDRNTHYIKFFQTDTTPKLDIHGREPRGQLEAPHTTTTGVRIASLTDILYHKMTAMARRDAARDGYDVRAILESGLDPDKVVWAVHQTQWSRHLDGDAITRLINKLREPELHRWETWDGFSKLAEHIEAGPSRTHSLHATAIEAKTTGVPTTHSPDRQVQEHIEAADT